MPYISRHSRIPLEPKSAEGPHTAGELNYQITMVVKQFLGHYPSYTEYNSAIGALECAKLELYRRMVAPYEDRKIEENGDVY